LSRLAAVLALALLAACERGPAAVPATDNAAIAAAEQKAVADTDAALAAAGTRTPGEQVPR